MNGGKRGRSWTLPLILLLLTLAWAAGYYNGRELIRVDWEAVVAWGERRIPLLSYVVPIVFAIMNEVLLVLSLLGLRRAERLFSNAGDDGEQYARAQRRLKAPMFYSNVAKILNFLFFTLSVALAGHPYQSENTSAVVGIAGMCLLLIGFAWVVLIQRRCARMPDFYSPENQSNIVKRSRRSWLEDCDENERRAVYKAGYRAYSTAKTLCVILWALSLAAQLLLHASVWPGVCICVIYLGMTLSFARGNSKSKRR